MSKAISFGFGKSKVANSNPLTQRKPPAATKSQGTLLRANDSDNEDEAEPQHESVAGFSSDGVILSKPVQPKEVKIIQNSGNGDWRNRGRSTNLLPAEVQAAQNGTAVLVEKDEVSTVSGLQYAAKEPDAPPDVSVDTSVAAWSEPAKSMTEDEIAMAALLGDRPKSNAIIATSGNARLTGQDETADFREDVATRPDSSTLEEYAAMPVEEFGMAMLRGMGQKRKAAGQNINLEADKEANPRKVRKQEGFLGIGAKSAPGADVELGAWGKADMRKNNKGQGFFTPLMRENKSTGERITEEEFQKRMKDSKGAKEEDWRERRDRNLERSGRDRDRDRERDTSKRNSEQKAITNGSDHESSRHSSSSRRDRKDGDDDRSRSHRHRDDRGYDSSRSRRERSWSRDRRRREDERDDLDSRHREKHRERYRDDDRYDSGSSHRSRHRDRDEDRDEDRDRNEDRRHRDRR